MSSFDWSHILCPMLLEEPSCPHEKLPVDSPEKHEDATDTTASDKVLKAKSLRVLEHAPDDEVEGEMVYLQARLLDNAVVLKHRYGMYFSHCFYFVYPVCSTYTYEEWYNHLTSSLPIFQASLTSILCMKLSDKWSGWFLSFFSAVVVSLVSWGSFLFHSCRKIDSKGCTESFSWAGCIQQKKMGPYFCESVSPWC